MTTEIIPTEQKSLVRLKTFFSPYPQFFVSKSEQKKLPIVVRKKNTKSEQTFRFHVSVSSVLLHPAIPEWIHSTLLQYTKRYARATYSEPESAEDMARKTESFSKLEELFEEEKKHFEEVSLPNPEEGNNLRAIWEALLQKYFPDREDLKSYSLVWSNRGQTQSLASCNVYKKRVQVAAALNTPNCSSQLEPLLYHELCHAVLGPPKIVRGRAIFHGAEFKALEKKHPKTKELNRWMKSGGWEKAVEDFKQVQKDN